MLGRSFVWKSTVESHTHTHTQTISPGGKKIPETLEGILRRAAPKKRSSVCRDGEKCIAKCSETERHRIRQPPLRKSAEPEAERMSFVSFLYCAQLKLRDFLFSWVGFFTTGCISYTARHPGKASRFIAPCNGISFKRGYFFVSGACFLVCAVGSESVSGACWQLVKKILQTSVTDKIKAPNSIGF